MEVELAKLGRFIADHFDLDQLWALCRDVGISYDQLVGSTRSAKAFDLVTLARDRGRLSTLLASVARAYPDAFDANSLGSRRRGQRAKSWRWAWTAVLAAGTILALFGGYYISRVERSESTPQPGLVAAATPSLSPSSLADARWQAGHDRILRQLLLVPPTGRARA